MRRLFVLITALLFTSIMLSQELNCNVVVNAQFTGSSNVQVFKTLENQLREFINNRRWTKKSFQSQERINCSMFINIQANTGDTFTASLQIQSERPVFNSSYATPVYNFNDEDFSFQYVEFQNLLYSPNQFESNLVSVLAFHIYMILGIDADSFELNGGNPYYDQARAILNYSQQENFAGWQLQDGLRSRFALIDNVLSPTYKEYRNSLYKYHIEGLDKMHEDVKEGKKTIASTIDDLVVLNKRRPNSFILQVFFDAKAEEIQSIFSGGPSVNIKDLVDNLYKIAPTHSNKWRNINF